MDRHNLHALAPRATIAALALIGVALTTAPLGNASPTDPPRTSAGLTCLLKAYPKHLCKAQGNTLTWCDGTTMVYDDGRDHRDYEALLNKADLKAMMATPYPRGRAYPHPGVNVDPGRVRHEPFFRKMYGDAARDVSRTLAPVRWLKSAGGKTLHVTRVNDVHLKLQAVSDELERRVAPDVLAHIAKTSGTFVWRTVKGTERLSMHSFAIAIDVGVKEYGDYWKWSSGGRRPIPYRNRMPLEVVEIFERHGFIWGGKWYHYDTMHFEYRPELLAPGCAR